MGKPSSGLDDTMPASSPPEGAEDAPSEQHGERYRLGAELGRGGMGRVVEAFDVQLGRTVALKEVLPNAASGLARRFRREVEITARLEHPSIVPLYDAGTTDDGRPFYVMRRVTGRPLDELVTRARTLDDRMALLPHMLAAIDGIAHAHKRGVIHRDLKPANILVGELGETVVIDWGLAKIIGEQDPVSNEPRVPTAADSLQTQVGSVFGTPGFMAPEQARGEELDPSGDVFALGATLYHLLAGRPPVKGTSATEMIEGTLQHEIPPLPELVSGVPAELVAIVDKALAFERDERYADAGALGEDLRRFTTGQLVAAHDYTALQRVRRFARRNRAPLSVAALALAALAVLAWVGVHSVMRERDVASAERARALEQTALAEKRAAELARQADQLRLLHARTLIDTNPTQAIAALKDVGSDPASVADARAIAKAAAMRGVAWGAPALSGLTVALQLSHDGRRLLQVVRDGKLEIVDLDARRVSHTHEFGRSITAGWAAGDTRVFVQPDHQKPQLYDPASGRSTEIDTVGCRDWSASEHGDIVVCIDENDVVQVIDLATATAKPLWTGKAGSELAIALDASWVAFADRSDRKQERLLVLDRSGRELVHRAGRVAAPVASAGGKLALISDGVTVEVKPGDPAPVFTTVPLTAAQQIEIHFLAYRGEVLEMFGIDSLYAWNGRMVWTSDQLRDGLLLGSPVGDDRMVVSTSDGRLHVMGDGVVADLATPGPAEGMVKIASRAGVARFAATCRNALCVWDSEDVLPRPFDATTPGFFVDDHRVVLNENLLPAWRWVDLESGKRGKLPAGPLGLPEHVEVAPDGRLLVLVGDGSPISTAAVFSPDLAHVTTLKGVTGQLARLVDGGGVVAATGKNKIAVQVGDAAPAVALKVDGDVIGLFEAGPLRFVALTSKGELLRCQFDGKDLVRTHVAIEPGAFVVVDSQGRAIVASGAKLLRWDQDVHEIATLPHPIDGVSVIDGALLVSVDGGEAYYVPDGGVPRRLPLPAGRETQVADHAPAVFGLTSGRIAVVDLPSLALWTLPKTYAGFDQYAISPDGHYVLQLAGGGVQLWELPRPGGDFGAWLDELTNATEADGILTWPW